MTTSGNLQGRKIFLVITQTVSHALRETCVINLYGVYSEVEQAKAIASQLRDELKQDNPFLKGERLKLMSPRIVPLYIDDDSLSMSPMMIKVNTLGIDAIWRAKDESSTQ